MTKLHRNGKCRWAPVIAHRIGLTLYRLEDIMNGNLDEVLDALATADELARLAGQQEEA